MQVRRSDTDAIFSSRGLSVFVNGNLGAATAERESTVLVVYWCGCPIAIPAAVAPFDLRNFPRVWLHPPYVHQ